MDDRSRIVGLLFLGILGVGALALMGACALSRIDPPPAIAAAFGVAVGALAGLLPPTQGRGQ